MATRVDIEQLALKLEHRAEELRNRAATLDARAEAMDRDREAFALEIGAALQHLRSSAGLPAKPLPRSLAEPAAHATVARAQ